MGDKKSRYTPAQGKSTQKYMKENLEEIRFRVYKGEKKRYADAAAEAGLSVTQFFLSAADEKISREHAKARDHEKAPGKFLQAASPAGDAETSSKDESPARDAETTEDAGPTAGDPEKSAKDESPAGDAEGSEETAPSAGDPGKTGKG